MNFTNWVYINTCKAKNTPILTNSVFTEISVCNLVKSVIPFILYDNISNLKKSVTIGTYNFSCNDIYFMLSS